MMWPGHLGCSAGVALTYTLSGPNAAGAEVRREAEVLRIVVDRREEPTRQRIQVVNRLQRLLAELTSPHVARWNS